VEEVEPVEDVVEEPAETECQGDENSNGRRRKL
jgi:hypothetical protein